MDRTIMQNITIFGAAKRAADTDKFSDSFLCDEIYNNLRALSFIHPFTDEFKDLFERGMFMKSNPKAFPHIMKYLFTICDPIEFKKKFCWPIYNKAAEATFRNSTLEFLNKLNGKYNLGLTEIKNKILVFPGGIEFMRVIYELTRLTMQLLLKRNGISIAEPFEILTLGEATKKLELVESLCESVTELNRQIETHSDDLKSKTLELQQFLQSVTSNTNILPSDILEDKFTNNWNDVHEQVVENCIEPETQRMEHFQVECIELERKLCAICDRQLLKFNLKSLESFSMEMQRLYPQYYRQMSTIIVNNRIDLNHLILATYLALPAMLYSITSYKPRSTDALAYESNYLNKLSMRLTDLILKTSQLSVDYEQIAFESGVDGQPSQVLQDLTSLILSTPTISHNAIKRADNGIGTLKRISLIEDITHLKVAATKPSKLLNPILEESKQNLSMLLSPFKEDKPKLDPMKILLSIKKKEKGRPTGNFKQKSINFQHLTVDDSKQNDTTMSVPDFSSTLIRLDPHDGIDQLNNSLMNTSNVSERGEGKERHRGPQNFSTIIADVNQSPSGRIDATSRTDLNGAKSKKLINKEIPTIQIDDLDATEKENNRNASNKFIFNSKKFIDENAESLLNVSDGILMNIDINDSL